MKTILTISRQFGSGGRLIGRLVAEKLGIPFYDREIIDLAAQKSGFASEFIKENEQKLKGLSTYAHTAPLWGGGLWGNFDNFESRIYAAEAEAIEHYASLGGCVIVGRCADYVLKDKAECLNVFIHADIESRAKRVIEVYHDESDEKRAQKLVRDADRLRARHYRYYTDAEWGDSANYHISLDSAKLGIEKCVELLVRAYQVVEESSKEE